MKRPIIGIVTLLVLVSAGQANCAIVSPGFDLLTTQPGAFFDLDGPGPLPLVDMIGVPIVMFDFGSGPVGVNTTDTIVKRLAPASGPGIDTIPIEMVSLQLISTAPIPLGLLGGVGFDLIGATLSSDRGRHVSDPGLGAASSGTMAIDFDTSTFTSSISLEFDLRAGGVFGPILPGGIGIIKLIHNPTPIPWASAFGSQSILVPQLEVSNPPGYTWHPFIATPDSGGGGLPLIILGVNEGFIVGVGVIPEPSTLVIWSLLGVLGLTFGWRRRRKAA